MQQPPQKNSRLQTKLFQNQLIEELQAHILDNHLKHAAYIEKNKVSFTHVYLVLSTNPFDIWSRHRSIDEAGLHFKYLTAKTSFY